MNDETTTASTSTGSLTFSNAMLSPVAAVSVKLPPFWPIDPVVWFAQVEAQFLTRNITSQVTKYAYVVASLQPEIAQEVRDLLVNPPTAEPYDQLKAELIKRTSASEQKRFHQLLTSEELGDRKPSQLLRKMRQLLGDNRLEDSLLRKIFLNRLPINAQLILASTPESVSTDNLATLADKIMEVATPAPPVAAFAASNTTPSSEVAELRQQISTLSAQVQALTNRYTSQPRSGPRGRSPTPSRSPYRRNSSTERHASSQCWYHWRFGSAARKCNPPCSFTFKPSASQQQENFPASG